MIDVSMKINLIHMMRKVPNAWLMPLLRRWKKSRSSMTRIKKILYSESKIYVTNTKFVTILY